MKKTSVLWIVIVFLLAIIVAIGVKFVVLGSTAPADDGRTAVLLTKAERQGVLGEMRALLVAKQKIIYALAMDDMGAVIAAAEPLGSAAIATVDFDLRAKLPLGFKKLGFATHYAFDDIANMAKEGKPVKDIQLKVAETMNNCIACHEMYQLPEAKQ